MPHTNVPPKKLYPNHSQEMTDGAYRGSCCRGNSKILVAHWAIMRVLMGNRKTSLLHSALFNHSNLEVSAKYKHVRILVPEAFLAILPCRIHRPALFSH